MKYLKYNYLKTRFVFFIELLTSNRYTASVLRAIPFWIASLLTGLVAVSFTKMFTWSENFFFHIFGLNHLWVFLITPLCFVISWAIIEILAPNARGSGIPQVMAAIEVCKPNTDYLVSTLLSFRIIITKILSSLV